jgi:low temperature requirement protein LtrA
MVVAIASAAAQWHHGIAEGHLGDVAGFLMAFFAIWLAWLNYTWFASAYDCDDVVYRLLTFVIMTGSLMLAAGIPELFRDGQSVLLVAGYVVMRLAMVLLWLRAARGDAERRTTAMWYARGILLVQVFWVLRLLVHDQPWVTVTFLVGVGLELAVPPLAERHGMTPFHPHHISERYSLLTIIVLGEVILASVQAVQGAIDDVVTADLFGVIAGGLLIVYAMWWLYFKRDHVDLFQRGLREISVVGYGHYLVFAAGAATGAGLAAAVDVAEHHAHVGPRAAGLALAGAIATYLLVLGGIRVVADQDHRHLAGAVVVAVLVLAMPLVVPSMGLVVLGTGVVLAGAVAHDVWQTRAVAPTPA